MYLRRRESGWVALAPAKINLYLEVTGKRTDGYHELVTFMAPVRLFDSLSLVTSPPTADGPGPIELQTRWSIGQFGRLDSESSLPDDQSNLVIRALGLLQQASGCPQGARVELVKRIPLGAGLGGGSSDAAAALRLANQAWQLGWNHERLEDLAAQLGSDVPFFLAGGAAVCRGRGERVQPVGTLAPLACVIAKPREALSTAQVFRALDSTTTPDQPERGVENLLQTLRTGNLGSIGRFMTNRLASTAMQLVPSLAGIQAAFAELDFVAHQLTGSGSAYFGICRNGRHANRLAATLRGRIPGWCYATYVSR